MINQTVVRRRVFLDLFLGRLLGWFPSGPFGRLPGSLWTLWAVATSFRWTTSSLGTVLSSTVSLEQSLELRPIKGTVLVCIGTFEKCLQPLGKLAGLDLAVLVTVEPLQELLGIGSVLLPTFTAGTALRTWCPGSSGTGTPTTSATPVAFAGAASLGARVPRRSGSSRSAAFSRSLLTTGSTAGGRQFVVGQLAVAVAIHLLEDVGRVGDLVSRECPVAIAVEHHEQRVRTGTTRTTAARLTS